MDDRSLIPGRGWDFFPRHSFQTDSGAHTASFPMDTGSCFPGGNAAGTWN